MYTILIEVATKYTLNNNSFLVIGKSQNNDVFLRYNARSLFFTYIFINFRTYIYATNNLSPDTHTKIGRNLDNGPRPVNLQLRTMALE